VPDNPEDLPVRKLETDAIECGKAAILLDKVVCYDHGGYTGIEM
jgi:hypothetical protein